MLGAARAAVKAVEQMLENKAKAAYEEAERKAQGQIDEAASRTRPIKEM